MEDAAVEASDDTDEARNIQASPEIPPATTTDTDVEENLTEATPATEAPATDQPPTPSATVVPPMATPSPEEVAAYALEQMQKQLKEKDDAHVKELERVKAEKDAELERLQNARAAQTKQVAELQRVTSLAEQKLAAERATLQRAEREQRQRQEQEQAARAERQRLHEEEIANLRQLLAAVARVQQAQAANPAPAAAATPAPTPQPAQAANPTPTPPTAAAGATATETDDEPEEVHHARRFVWNGLHTTILVIILATVAALLILSSNNFAPSSEKLADMGDEAEIIRLQEESNRTKIKAVADSQKSAAALVPTPVVLDAEEKAFTGKGGDLSLAPSSIRDGARASVNMLNNSKFGDNARIEVNNKIDIHDNRQDNRQAIVHPNGWPLDWRPTLPVVVASDLPKGVSTFIIPLRGVQCIRVPVGWYIEPAMQDMAHIDVKYGNDTMCFDYGIGQPGNEISGNYTQIRIRPKGHEQTDVTVRVMVTPP